MEILFLILKIIGILFAALLLLIFAVFAVPVRYGVCVEVQEDIMVSAVFHWFCRLINMKIEYKENNAAFQLRILFVPVSFGRKKKKRSKKRRNSSLENKNIDKGYSHAEEERLVPEPAEEQDLSVSEPENRVNGKRKSSRIGKWRKNIRTKLEKLRLWILNVKNKFITGKDKIHNIKKLIWEETNKSAFLHLLKEMKILMRHYSPRKACGQLAFGMEDPSHTGQILGILGAFPFWAKYKIHVMPDFQAEGFFVKGKLQMKGHIRAWHMIWSVFRLIKDRNIRLLVTSFRT